jgi:hypothetical protein
VVYLNCWRYRYRQHPEGDHHLAYPAHDRVTAHRYAPPARPDRYPDRQAFARDAEQPLVAGRLARSGQSFGLPLGL